MNPVQALATHDVFFLTCLVKPIIIVLHMQLCELLGIIFVILMVITIVYSMKFLRNIS